MKSKDIRTNGFFALAGIALLLTALMSEARAQENLDLLKTYDLGAIRYSEGLDFYDGFLWYTSSGSLYKLDPDNATDIDSDGDYDLFADLTWDFTHNSYSESSVWFEDELYNFTFWDSSGMPSDDIYKLYLNPNETYSWLHVGDGLGTTNWGSCRDKRTPGESIIYTGHYDNLLMWYDPFTGNTTRTLVIPGLDEIEDLGMDRYGRV
jgi:glutamine cyclotransferase